MSGEATGARAETPLVSVVIPVYNREKLIVDALRSVFSQRLSEMEVIVVDDGSTDGTARAIRESGYSVELISQENSGVSAARNAGLAVARGRYVAFLDSDDRWLEGKLAAQIASLEADASLAAVCSDGRYVAEGTSEPASFAERTGAPEEPSAIRECLLDFDNPVMMSSVMARREVLDQYGGFDTSISIGEDFDLWFRISSSWGIRRLPEVMIEYLRHDANTLVTRPLAEQVEQSERLLEKNLSSHPRQFRGARLRMYREYGWAASRRGDWLLALGLFLKALRVMPLDTRLWCYLCLSLVPNRMLEMVKSVRRRLARRDSA